MTMFFTHEIGTNIITMLYEKMYISLFNQLFMTDNILIISCI